MSDFQSELIEKLVSSLNNNFETMPDPWFTATIYKERKQVRIENFKDRIIVNKIGDNYSSKWNVKEVLSAVLINTKELSYYKHLYDLLSDNHSRKILIEVAVHRLIGEKKIKQSIEGKEYENLHRSVNDAIIQTGSHSVNNFAEWPLNLYDLRSIGYNKKIHYTTMGIVTTFGVEQYNYKNIDITPSEGSIILDCGGCWGDTALYFIEKVKKCKVFTFEFIPSNIALLEENLKINNVNSVEIIPHPVWDKSDEVFYAIDKGPISTLSDQLSEGTIEISTIAIDDFVQSHKLDKVDFIKMDIEGAETKALKGACKVITKHKPTLAIAIYHSPNDFQRIPQFINELNLGYKFYLSHNTPHAAETVLFAVADD